MGIFDLFGGAAQPAPQTGLLGDLPPAPSPWQYSLAGAGQALQPLMGATDRPVSTGQVLGALGGGLMAGQMQGREAALHQQLQNLQAQQLAGQVGMQRLKMGMLSQEMGGDPTIAPPASATVPNPMAPSAGGAAGGPSMGGSSPPAGNAAPVAQVSAGDGSGTFMGLRLPTGMSRADAMKQYVLDPELFGKIVATQYTGPTDLAKLQQEQKMYPPGSPQFQMYATAIQHAAGATPTPMRADAYTYVPGQGLVYLPKAPDGFTFVGDPTKGDTRVVPIQGALPAKKAAIINEGEAHNATAPQANPVNGAVELPTGAPQGQPASTPAGNITPGANNFGNLRVSDANWEGKVPNAGGDFETFQTPEHGVAALSKNLQSYGRQGVSTLADAITRWSPPTENDTPKLINNASMRTGFSPNQKIDLSDPDTNARVTQAIIAQEGRGRPTIQQLSNGIGMAFVPKPAAGQAAPPAGVQQAPATAPAVPAAQASKDLPEGANYPPAPTFGLDPNKTYKDLPKNIVQLRDEDTKRLSTYASGLQNDQELTQNMHQLQEILNNGLKTGYGGDRLAALTNFAQRVGLTNLIPENFNPNDAAEFAKVSARLAAAMAGQSGDATDAKLANSIKGNVNLNLPVDANKNIVNATVAGIDWRNKRAQAALDYANTHGGWLGGGAFENEFGNRNKITSGFDALQAEAAKAKQDLNPQPDPAKWQSVQIPTDLQAPSSTQNASVGGQSTAQKPPAFSLPPVEKRVVGQTYLTPKGSAVWRGQGWELVGK